MGTKSPQKKAKKGSNQGKSKEQESKKKVTQKKAKTPATKRKILDRVIVVFLVLALLGTMTGFSVLGYIIAKTDTNNLVEQIYNKEPSTFYAADGTPFAEMGEENRENIKYNQIPQSTIDAFLAIEDSRFYKHNGFDLPRFISSAINNVKAGDLSQGGSTLTMQTVDNFIIKHREAKAEKEGKSLSSLDKIISKVQEIYLSMRLENDLSKEEILTSYLNQINFGDQARGIEKGALYFFGKHAEELNLSESAFLAGCINAPNTYNPYRGYDLETRQNYYQYATQRRNETLSLMLMHGYITETEYALAKSTELAFSLVGQSSTTNDPYLNYARKVQEEVIEMTGKDPAVTPMKIYTALDLNAQTESNRISSGEAVDLTDNTLYQMAFTVIDNSNGEIVAINSGRNDVEEKFYRARFDEMHQPGSSVKPLFDYAPAFDKLGWCTSRVFIDKAVEIDGRTIRNSDGKYYGKVTMDRAIAGSLNTVAIQSFNDIIASIGMKEFSTYMKKMGFDEETAELADGQYSIGGSNMLASPTQMAGAYASFANGGKYIEPHTVRRIEYKDGKTKPVTKEVKTEQVLSPQAAYLMSDLLYQAVNGKNKGWNLMGRLGYGAYPVYGKTGTSDWADSGLQWGIPTLAMKDEWMINYTSEYTIATWSGFDTGEYGLWVTDELLYKNVPGWINKHMLDSISKNPVRIPNPGGISNYGGGLIKTEWLASAGKNNPMTAENANSSIDPLMTLLEKVKGYAAADYTADSFALLQQAIAAANKIIDKDIPSDEEIKGALDALESAVNGLTSNSNRDSLIGAINSAAALDSSKYTADTYNNLASIVTQAKAILDKKGATQAEIDGATQNVNNAINALHQIPAKDASALSSMINAARMMASALPADKAQSLNNAIAVAEGVLNNSNATQDNYNAQTSALQNLMNSFK